MTHNWHAPAWHAHSFNYEGVNGMAFFQDLGGRLSEAAQSVSKRTSTASMVGKLNRESADVADQIGLLYTQIGKLFYAAYLSQSEIQGADCLCERIDTLNGQLQKIGQQLDEIKGQRRCAECGEVEANGARFCSNCGAKLPEEPVVAEETIEEAEPIDEPQDEHPVKPKRDPSDINVEINWPEAKTGQTAQEISGETPDDESFKTSDDTPEA